MTADQAKAFLERVDSSDDPVIFPDLATFKYSTVRDLADEMPYVDSKKLRVTYYSNKKQKEITGTLSGMVNDRRALYGLGRWQFEFPG